MLIKLLNNIRLNTCDFDHTVSTHGYADWLRWQECHRLEVVDVFVIILFISLSHFDVKNVLMMAWAVWLCNLLK